MTRSRTADDPRIPSVYVVAWPDGVWKVGYATTYRRWYKFLSTGATLVDLTEFGTDSDALDFERVMAAAFRGFSTYAYATADDPAAQRRMRSRHAIGYTECFRVDQSVLDEHYHPPGVHQDEFWGTYVGEHCTLAMVHLQAYMVLSRYPESYASHVPWTERQPLTRGAVTPILEPNMWAVA